MKTRANMILCACLICAALLITTTVNAAASKPNIVYILCDDLGYGDVHCLNPQGKIATPHADKLASQGMIFTDAHSSSSVCSPTRYGIMTGRYNWRSRLQSFVLGGLSPRLIEPGRLTVPALLKKSGYYTACVGKWHLGMDWVKKEGKDVSELNIEKVEQVWNVDYTKPITNGPNSVGFDYYYGISASLDMVPYTFIENDRVTVVPTVDKDWPLMLGREQGRCRKGPATPEFEVENVLPTLTRKAVEIIAARAADAKAGKPFFLYLPLNAPHTPIAPTKEWQGKSGLNPYADFVMQTDATLGAVMDALEKSGVAENTLLIFTSDNGCSPQADFPALLAKGHNPSYQFRGHKADIWDGGHHIPFVVRWPGKVQPGSSSEQLVCLTDLMATCAAILQVKLPDNAGEDSVSMMMALQGTPTDLYTAMIGTRSTGWRETAVHHSISGKFSIREGRWKLELCPGSGGWSTPRDPQAVQQGLPKVQLYDMAGDVGEKVNVQEKHPDVVSRLTKLLEKYVADGRSTPGAPQKNEVAVDIWKPDKAQPVAKKQEKRKPAN
ncbi:MAG: arylsulfatase [Verrucomicrobia bacterium]|nr:arylsulfatase [Verrucomicrobiota bacterium]